jgi:hypothetical protein
MVGLRQQISRLTLWMIPTGLSAAGIAVAASRIA